MSGALVHKKEMKGVFLKIRPCKMANWGIEKVISTC